MTNGNLPQSVTSRHAVRANFVRISPVGSLVCGTTAGHHEPVHRAQGVGPLTTRLLSELEAYYDAVPRAACRVEQIGPFTLFVNRGPGWPYYARPALGTTQFSAADVHRVRARQRALGIP